MISYSIFIVDDEESIRDSVTMSLEDAYRVAAFANAESALSAIDVAPPDLVLLDMIMPDMGGGEVYDRMKDINRNVKAILATGYSLDGEASRILKKGCDGVIQKPYSIDRLSRVIYRVLKRAGAAKEKIAN